MITIEATSTDLAIIRAVERINLLAVVVAQRDRVEHFSARMLKLGMSPSEWVIVVLEVDDPDGRKIADLLMPFADWDAIRHRDGGRPFARGLANRQAMQLLLIAGSDGARELADLDGIGVLAVGSGIAAVYSISEVLK